MTKSSFFSGTGVSTTNTNAIENSVEAAAESATAASTSAASSAASAASASSNAAANATSAAASEASRVAAVAAKTAAETAETNAETAETNAETAETNAASSATSAAASASTATTKASEASTSASTASTKASEANTSATNSATSASASASSATSSASSATASAASATSASTAKTAAETAETNAETAETNAASSATSASASATTATTKASEASTSASTATTKASEAATSATASETSKVASEAAKDAALAALDNFDDRYLGSKSSAPTVDNDGDALASGMLYFNTTTDEMKVYDGSQWLNAYASLSGALLATSNLSDLNNAGTARTNLGLGTAATTAASAYATAAQGTKVDGIEASADVTDTTNVTAAGALMDSEVTNLAQVKAFDSSDYATAAQGTTADAALSKSGGAMTGAITTNSTFDGRDVATDGTKLDGIEASADVTDTANVTAAGALMDSELTSIASVKALNQGVATTDSPTFAGLNASSDLTLDVAGDIILDADGADVILKDGGTSFLEIDKDGSNARLKNPIADGDIKIQGIDGASTITMVSFDASSAGAATFNAGATFNGTATMDGLILDAAQKITYNANGSQANSRKYQLRNDDSAYGDFGIKVSASNSTEPTKNRFNIASNGDISFYEDTGTTAKFFWDASAESLGIGTTVPASLLHIQGNTDTADSFLTIEDADPTTGSQRPHIKFVGNGTQLGKIRVLDNGTGMQFLTGSSDNIRLAIDSSGSSVFSGSVTANGLTVDAVSSSFKSTGATAISIIDTDVTNDPFKFNIENGGRDGRISVWQDIIFSNTGAGETVRIDTSGNLLVGTTDTNPANDASGTGVAIGNGGWVAAARSGDTAGMFNRLSSDGNIVTFHKDGTTVGDIGVNNNDNLRIQGNSGHCGLEFGTNAIYPHKNSANVDNQIDLGESGLRYKDLYLSSGVYLGGTGAANKLDDYEEGTWTPVLTGTGYSFGTHTGRYVKVGNLVYITALFNVTAVGSNNSIVGWSGAPFTTEAVTNLHQMGVVRESSTTGRLYQIQINTGSSSGSMNSMDGIAGGSNEIFTTGHYAVSVTYKI